MKKLPMKFFGVPKNFIIEETSFGIEHFRDNAEVAQLVEQGFCKPQVAGSNPVLGSIYAEGVNDPEKNANRDKKERFALTKDLFLSPKAKVILKQRCQSDLWEDWLLAKDLNRSLKQRKVFQKS